MQKRELMKRTLAALIAAILASLTLTRLSPGDAAAPTGQTVDGPIVVTAEAG